MLEDIIEHLRRTLPDAFKDEEPRSMIPWTRDREIGIERPEVEPEIREPLEVKN